VSPQLDSALTSVAWCFVLYCLLLCTEAATRLYAQIYVLFKRSEEHATRVQYTRDYIDALNKLADSDKGNEEPK